MYKELINLYLLNKNINVVDVGARNGMTLLGDFSQYCNLFGFEPNPQEYEKLITNTTDHRGGGFLNLKKPNIFAKLLVMKLMI
jgi:hypothetical protein